MGFRADSAELTIRAEGIELVSLKVDLPEAGLCQPPRSTDRRVSQC
ncbi:MAG: hypothetical protein Ct9H300mP15_22670 [Gemmatimonadota bacterium]|nr:MAG: hypothetical protein Ct9H300mP15_22670 [Gemmatimonadota bacterium]